MWPCVLIRDMRYEAMARHQLPLKLLLLLLLFGLVLLHFLTNVRTGSSLFPSLLLEGDSLPEIRVTEATQPLEDEKEKLSLNLVENYLSNTSIAATLDEDKLTKERQNHKDAQIMQEELYDAMVHRQAKEHYECVQSCLEHLHFGKESFEVSEEENQCGKKAAAREEGQR